MYIYYFFSKLHHRRRPASTGPRLLEKPRQQGHGSRGDSGLVFLHCTWWDSHNRHLYRRWVRVSRGRCPSAHSPTRSPGHPAVFGGDSAGTEAATVAGYLSAGFLQAAIPSAFPLLNRRIWGNTSTNRVFNLTV